MSHKTPFKLKRRTIEVTGSEINMDDNDKPESITILSTGMPVTVNIDNAYILMDLLHDTLKDIEKYNIIENKTIK